MIKQIKYNRCISKFKSFLSGLKENTHHEHHLGYFVKIHNISVHLTIYNYDSDRNELRINYNLKKYIIETNNLDDGVIHNMICDYFFDNHNISGVKIFINTIENGKYFMKQHIYDKAN